MKLILLLLGALALHAQPAYNGLRILPDQAHSTPGYVRFFENSAVHYVGLKAPGTVAANITFQLPNALPASTLCVFSDSSGILTTAPCVVQGSGCVSVSGTTVSSTCPNITYTAGNAIQFIGSQINANYSGAGTVSITGSTITGLTYTGTGAISVNSGTRVISGTYTGGGCVSVNNATGVISCTVPASLTAGTCININGSNQIVNTCSSSETGGNFGATNISTSGTIGGGAATVGSLTMSGSGTGNISGVNAISAGSLFLAGNITSVAAINATGTISTTGGMLASGGVGAAGFNPGSNFGVSTTTTVRNSAGSGTCTIVFQGGVNIGTGTC